MTYKIRETSTPYIIENSVYGEETEMVLTPTRDPVDFEIEEILNQFAQEHIEE